MPSRSDYDLWIRIAEQFKLGYIRDPLVNYYVHGDGLSGNPAKRLRGMEVLLEKHRDFFARSVTDNSRRHRTMGMLYCRLGDVRKARGAFRRAAQIDPWEVRNYLYLVLSLFAPGSLRKVKAFKERLGEVVDDASAILGRQPRGR
jgi:hypothetical protein